MAGCSRAEIYHHGGYGQITRATGIFAVIHEGFDVMNYTQDEFEAVTLPQVILLPHMVYEVASSEGNQPVLQNSGDSITERS